MPIRGRGRWPRAPVDEQHPDGVIEKYVALRKPGFERAIRLLKEIGHAVKTLMQVHGWSAYMLVNLQKNSPS